MLPVASDNDPSTVTRRNGGARSSGRSRNVSSSDPCNAIAHARIRSSAIRIIVS